MLRTLIALSVVFGLIVADPLPKISTSSSNVIARTSSGLDSFSPNEYSSPYYNDDVSLLDLAVQPESTSLIAHVLTSLIGYKTSALSLAVAAISWLVSNFYVIITGAVATFGFCKLTGHCSLDYQVFEPAAARFHSLMTPQRLASAERFLVKAVEKYAEENGRS